MFESMRAALCTTTIVACACCLPAGCTRESVVSPAVFVSNGSVGDADTNLEDIARLVDHRYATAKTLQMVQVVEQDPDRVTVNSVMTPTALRTEAATDAGPFAIYLFKNGIMTEYGDKLTTSSGVQWQRHEYPAPTPAGGDDSHFKTKYGCLYGSNLSTWIGPNARFRVYLATSIRQGRFLRRDKFNGSPCIIVRKIQEYGPGDYHLDDYWINADTGTLHRWMSEDAMLKHKTVTRDRQFLQIRFDEPVDSDLFQEGPLGTAQ